MLNDNIVATQFYEGVPLWFAIRIDLLAIMTMTVISIFCVLFRNKSNPVMLAMLLTYALSVQSVTIMTIRCMMKIEGRMV